MVFGPVFLEARVVLVVDQFEVDARTQLEAEVFDALFNHGRPADQDRERQAGRDDFLGSVQDALVLAFGQHDALFVLLGRSKHRLHEQVGLVDELLQLFDVGVHVLDRTGGHAGFHGGLGDGRGDLDDQARIERLGNQVFWAERQLLVFIGAGHHVVLLGHGQIGNGAHAGELHLFVDGGGADVQCTAEDERETQDVVDLVGEVRAAGADDGVRAGFFRQRRQDFRFRVGQGKDQRVGGHGLDHFRRHQLRTGQAEENVGIHDGVLEDAHAVVGNGKATLGFVHLFVAADEDHALGVTDSHVFTLEAQRDQQLEAGDGSRAGATAHEADLADVLAHHAQAVEDGGTGDDGSTVLVVVKDRNTHAFTAFLLDVEALRCLDVFEVDAAESRFQRADDVNQFVRVVFVDFDVENVNAGELLEEHALAFHHGLAGQRADVTQTQHGGAVGDDGHQIAPGRQGVGFGRVLDNGVTCGCHTGRVGQGQITLGSQRFGRGDLDLATGREAVIVECALAQLLVHAENSCDVFYVS